MIRSLVSFIVAAIVVSTFAANDLACSSKVCTSTEESTCTSAFTDCSSKAAATADHAACLKCVDNYCACYTACGNTCDKARLQGTCP